MSFLGWNCRGLGNLQKVPALKREIAKKCPQFVFLCETKLLVRELNFLGNKLGFAS